MTGDSTQVVDAIRAAHAEHAHLDGTHTADCWLWHPWCAVGVLLHLLDDTAGRSMADRLRAEADYQDDQYEHRVARLLRDAATELDRLTAGRLTDYPPTREDEQ